MLGICVTLVVQYIMCCIGHVDLFLDNWQFKFQFIVCVNLIPRNQGFVVSILPLYCFHLLILTCSR